MKDLPVESERASVFEKTLDVPSSTGGYAMREMMRFVFFIPRRNLDLAADAVKAFDRLIDLFPPPALDSFAIESGDWLTFDAPGLKAQIRKRLVGREQSVNASVSLAGDQANIPDFSVDYEGLAIDRPVFRTAVSKFWFSIGAGVFAPYEAAVLKLTRELVDSLDCSAAYGELALEGGRDDLQATARRYVNLDISNVSCVARDVDGKFPGVFWQNYIGPRLLSKLGGSSRLEPLLSTSAHIEETRSGGIFITLGAQPTRGDVSHNEAIEDRLALARHADGLQLLHTPKRVTYFDAEDDLSAAETQERWHRRFAT